jgi:hypothetical protein
VEQLREFQERSAKIIKSSIGKGQKKLLPEDCKLDPEIEESLGLD